MLQFIFVKGKGKNAHTRLSAIPLNIYNKRNKTQRENY